MIHAGQVQNSVQHQNPEFIFNGVAELGGLLRGAVERDGEFSRLTVRGRKREHIGGMILAPKLAIEFAKLPVVRDQARYGAPAAGDLRDFGEERTQCAPPNAPANRARWMAE
jgi:hypothetical protein